MADYNLGTAKGKIELDASGAVTGAAQANAAIGSIDTSTKGAAGGVTALGGAMVGLGAVALGGFGLAIKAAADFEKQMSGIKAVSGATEKQMDDLRKKALQLGADTKFSAGEAAGAMEELIKAGLSTEDVMNGAADATVALAAAGEVDLATAATIASNAMNQFNLSAEQMPRVADLIAGAANASAIDVNDFGMSLAQAGATANLIGLSFDDLALAITAMGNAGIKGSDAGTSLKTFMSNLQPVTEKQKQLFEDLGLTMESNVTTMNEMGNSFFDATGKIKPMEEIAGTLATALEGMSDAQKTATLEALFGSDAIRAAAIIAGEGAAGFETLAAAMGEVTATEVAETRMDNLAGSVEQLKGSFETLLITAGTPFLDFLRDIVDRITGVVNWMSSLNEETLKFVTAGVGIAGAVLVISGAMLLAGKALGPLIAGLSALRTVLMGIGALAAANPLGLLIAGLVAAGAALVYFYKNNEGFRKFIDDLVDKAIEFGKAVQQWFLETALPAIQGFWDGVYPILQGIGEFFTGTIIPAMESFVSFITGTLVPGIANGFGAIQGAIEPVLDWLETNVFATFFEVGNAIFLAIMRIVDVINIFLVPVFKSAFDIVVNIVQGAISVITPIITGFIDVITNAWRLFGDNLMTAFSIAWNAIRGTIETILGIIRGIAQVFIGIFSGDFDKFLEGLRTIWDAVWNQISTIFQTVWDTMKLVVENALDAIHLVIDTVWTTIKTLFESTWNGIKSAFETVWDAIKGVVERVTGTIEGIVDAFGGNIERIWDGFTGTIEQVWDTLWSTAESIISGAISGITLAIGMASVVWEGLWNTIKTVISTPINAIKTVINGIASAIDGAISAIKRLIDWVGKIPSPSSIADKVTPWDGWLPGFAVGGIVNRPTVAMIGEAGAEAVIPLGDTSRALALMQASGLDTMLLNAYGGVDVTGIEYDAKPASYSTVNNSGAGLQVMGDIVIQDAVDWDILMMQAESQLAGMS